LNEVDAIVEQVSGSPLAMANVARNLLLPKGQAESAMALCDKALAMAPDDGEIRAIRAEVFSKGVGHWYFSTLRDEARHAIYDRVLRRTLAAGGRVLEIGAGTGLFAMMAARAGADEVITCERRPAVAHAARAVIARNGLAETVSVVGKASTELEIGVDLTGQADVLVWDNLANDMMGAGALPALEDAVRRLVKPGGQVIPARCAIMAALAEDGELDRRVLGDVEGFDLSPFNAVAQPVYTHRTSSELLAIRSSAAMLFDFDFRTGGSFPAGRASATVVGSGGRANGVVQWLRFGVDDGEEYRPEPGAEAWAFGLEFRAASAPFEAAQGAPFTVKASHDREHLRIWLESS
jgi:protein arginine N-methyltransferase 7